MISHKVTRPVLASVIAGLAGKTNEKQLADEVAAYLVTEHRTVELKSLMRDVKQYRGDHDGILEVVAVSAFELSSEVKADIKKSILAVSPEASQVIISERHDPSVIGGVRLELANRQLDLTIQEKLRTFKNRVITSKSGVI